METPVHGRPGGVRANAAEASAWMRAELARRGMLEPGEANLSNIRRGPAQTALLGYWVDRQCAGRGLVPEGVVLALRFAFEDLALHRVEAGVLPRNAASLRVMEKLDLPCEGITRGMLEINGAWEDHQRFALLSEDWVGRREELLSTWVW